MAGKRFLIWRAVSSKKQAEEVSPQVQEEMARAHVAKWDGTVVDVLDVAESRDIVLLSDAAAAIPAYARLQEYIDRRTIDVLLCYDLSRLGRAYPLTVAIVELCRRQSILIYELDNPPRDLEPRGTYDEMLIRGFKAMGYQHETMKKNERARFGREGRAKKGELPQLPPYGYYWEYTVVKDEISGLPLRTDRAVAVDPDKAAIVREIGQRYLAGHGQNRIAEWLTQSGISTPEGLPVWEKNSVRVILKRAWTYAGYAEYYRARKTGYIRARGSWEPIWDEATAESIEKEQQARAANRRIADTPSRLTGLVICEHCGRPMRQMRNEDGSIRDPRPNQRHPDRIEYVRRRAKFYCVPVHPGGSIGTNRVLEALAAAFADLATLDLSAIPDNDTNQAEHLAAQLAAHDAAIAKHQRGLRLADDAFVAGVMDLDRYKTQVDKLRGLIEAEESAKTQLQAAADAVRQRGSRVDLLREVAARGPAALVNEDTAASNAWLRKCVRVMVRDNEVTDVVVKFW